MRTTQPFSKDAAREVAEWLGVHRPPRVPALPVLKGREAQDIEAWAMARDAGVGASDIGVITGVSSFSSTYALWWQKHLHWRLPQNEAMADGHAHEEMVAAEFRQRHPELYVAKPALPLWAHPEHPWAICTPDYLAVQVGEPLILEGTYTEDEARDARIEMADADPARRTATPHIVPVETKWDASKGWGKSGTQDVPEQYRRQVIWQAWIFGAPGGWLVNHKPTGTRRYREYWIPVDEALVDEMLAAGAAFVASLETGVSPDPDGSAATEVMLQEIHAGVVPGTVASVDPLLAAAWQEARDELRAAEVRKREMDNRLREALRDAERGIDRATGAVFVERTIRKRAGYEVAPGMVDSLRRINDGPSGEGGSVPAADGAGGDDGPAAAAGGSEAPAGGDVDHGERPAGAEPCRGCHACEPDEMDALPAGGALPGVPGDDRPQDGLLEGGQLDHTDLYEALTPDVAAAILRGAPASVTDMFLLREAVASVELSRDERAQTISIDQEPDNA